MPHRNFTDSLGRVWDVWSVVPEHADRRRQGDLLATSPERRHHSDLRVQLSPKWMNGWLAFETGGEKRRLAPIPDAWSDGDDAELERLCQSAELIAARTRRLIE